MNRKCRRMYRFRFWRYLLCDEIWRIRVRSGEGWESLAVRGVPCRRGFCADPFIVGDAGRTYLFYETLTRGGKGVLRCFERVGRRWAQRGCVLEEPWHLSYPQVFKDGDRWLMLPESKAGGGVFLYQAEAFPYRWKRIDCLLRGPYADSTILRWEGRWYLFAYREDGAGRCLELWVSECPEGPWVLHPEGACVQTSRRLSRPAGFCVRERDGRLFRLAQDCNGDYGKRVFRIPILGLSPIVYREGKAELFADRGLVGGKGTHTYNRYEANDGVLEVFDFKFFALKPFGRLMRDVVGRAWGFVARRLRGGMAR